VQLPAHACGDTFSGEPDVGKSACPVRRGESGSHFSVALSPTLPQANLEGLGETLDDPQDLCLQATHEILQPVFHLRHLAAQVSFHLRHAGVHLIDGGSNVRLSGWLVIILC